MIRVALGGVKVTPGPVLPLAPPVPMAMSGTPLPLFKLMTVMANTDPWHALKERKTQSQTIEKCA